MELGLYAMQLYPSSLFFWFGLSFFVVVFQCSATAALHQTVLQHDTILDATMHRSLSSSAVTAATTVSATAAVKGPTDNDSWLCRISKGFEACGNREYRGVDPPQRHAYCPEKFCCSKTACYGGCGNWCHNSWALCSSKAVYYPEWSYGNCNCKRFGNECHRDAECVHLNEANGGSYCQCKRGFLGNGKRCERDYCMHNPCYPGECRNLSGGYRCTCPVTHRVEPGDNGDLCKEKPNYCRNDPCGPSYMVEECINKEDGYDCKCKQGYTVQNNRCEGIDMCAGSPCGPAEGVHSCVTEREPKLRYRCQCNNGYDKLVLPDGESEVCRKNWCYGDPCGPQDRVMDCRSTDNGYSCRCNATYVVETDETGKEKCIKEDPCKQNPCGPPDIVKRCYAEGSSYRCECQPGYLEVEAGGHRTCTKEDPCLLRACGSEEKVVKCTTDGSNYTCTCREPDFLLGTEDGRKTCLSKQECIENCGPLEALRACAIEKGSFACKCNVGFAITYREGKRMCAPHDACKQAPCGPEEAVELCMPNSSGSSSPYSCTCKAGYEVRILEDKSEVCAKKGSCVGNPCGPPDIVKACIEDESEYSCQCAKHYEQGRVEGRKQCVSARTEEQFPTESGGMSDGAIVEECMPNTSGDSSSYSCICKAGYEARILEGKSEVCAKKGSCVGNPCGPPDIVKACIADESEYSCQCTKHYEQGRLGGRRRCVLANGEEHEKHSGTESEGMSKVAVAGSVVGGLLLVGSVGAYIASSRKGDKDVEDKPSENEDEAAGPEMPPPALDSPPPPIEPDQGPMPVV